MCNRINVLINVTIYRQNSKISEKSVLIAYKSKVNAFKKGKEMDVYINANEAEKIYIQN